MYNKLRAITFFGLLLGVQMGIWAEADVSSLREQNDQLLKENRRLLDENRQLQDEKNDVLLRTCEEPATVGKRIVAVGIGSGIGAITRYGSKRLAMRCGGRSGTIMQGILMVGLDSIRQAAVTQLIGEEYINLAAGATWGSRAAMCFAEKTLSVVENIQHGLLSSPI